MTKKIVWMVVGGLMALSLVMAACGPAAPVETTEEGEKKVISQPDEEKEQPKETEVVAEEVVALVASQLKFSDGRNNTLS